MQFNIWKYKFTQTNLSHERSKAYTLMETVQMNSKYKKCPNWHPPTQTLMMTSTMLRQNHITNIWNARNAWGCKFCEARPHMVHLVSGVGDSETSWSTRVCYQQHCGHSFSFQVSWCCLDCYSTFYYLSYSNIVWYCSAQMFF